MLRDSKNMYFSRGIRYYANLLLIVVVLIHAVSLDALPWAGGWRGPGSIGGGRIGGFGSTSVSRTPTTGDPPRSGPGSSFNIPRFHPLPGDARPIPRFHPLPGDARPIPRFHPLPGDARPIPRFHPIPADAKPIPSIPPPPGDARTFSRFHPLPGGAKPIPSIPPPPPGDARPFSRLHPIPGGVKPKPSIPPPPPGDARPSSRFHPLPGGAKPIPSIPPPPGDAKPIPSIPPLPGDARPTPKARLPQGNAGPTRRTHPYPNTANGMPMPVGHPVQPRTGVPPSTVINNHYHGPPIGSPQNPAGHPAYGHQMIYVDAPIQLNSEAGVDQWIKDIVAISAVNSIMNKAINEPGKFAAPAVSAGSAHPTPKFTNTVIYNQYGTSNATGSGANPVDRPFPSEPSGSNTNTATPNSGIQTGTTQPTSVTENNMNNQTAPSTFQYYIPREELWNLTETLFAEDEFNAGQYVKLNLQSRSLNPNARDVASAPLMDVKREAYAIPTIQILHEIYDNYEFDPNKKEVGNDETKRKENVLLDVFLETNIMTTAMNWLSRKGYIEPDSFEWKDTLRQMWMTRVNGAISGFERIFLAEKYDGTSILGGQNWVYFHVQEMNKRIQYMGYADKKDLGRNYELAKIHFKIDDTVKRNMTMLIGTPPELEMALYTICYYARPNDVCNVSLGGVKFNIYTHPVRYFGKNLIDLGLVYF